MKQLGEGMTISFRKKEGKFVIRKVIDQDSPEVKVNFELLLTPEQLEKVIEFVEKTRIYSKGDFVEAYAGMGEMIFGWITGSDRNGYNVSVWPDRSYTRFVTDNDMRGLSTVEKAQQYDHDRSQAVPLR